MHADAAVTGLSRTPATALRNTVQPLADVVNVTLKSRSGQTANHIEGRSSASVLQWSISAVGAAAFASLILTSTLQVTGATTLTPLAGTGTRVVTSTSTGILGNATTLAGANTWSDTQTFTSAPVINSATAMRIPYINGSKVLTTTANLAYDGTTITLGLNSIVASSGNTLIAGTFGLTGAATLTTLAGSGDRLVTATAAGLLGTTTAAAFGLVSGTGVIFKIAFWSSSSSITYSNDFYTNLSTIFMPSLSVIGAASAGSLGVSGAVQFSAMIGVGTRFVTVDSGGFLGTTTLPGAGGVLGTGTANQVAYWSATDTITGSGNLTFNGTTLALTGDQTVSGTLQVTGIQSNGAAIVFTGNGANGTGRIFRSATLGIGFRGFTGSVYDFVFITVSGNLLFANPTGTNNLTVGVASATVNFPGAVTMGSTWSLTGNATLTTLAGSGTRFVTADAAGLLGTTTISGAGGVLGTGVSGRVAYWSATDTITGSANLTFSGSALVLTGTQTISSTLDVTGIGTFSSRVNIGGAVDSASFVLNVAGGAIAVRGANSILSYAVGNPGDADYERMSLIHTGTAAELRSQASGTGTVRPLRIVVGSTTRYEISAAGAHTVTGAVSMSSTLAVLGVATIGTAGSAANNLVVNGYQVIQNTSGNSAELFLTTTGGTGTPTSWRILSLGSAQGVLGTPGSLVFYNGTTSTVVGSVTAAGAWSLPGTLGITGNTTLTTLAGTGTRLVTATAAGLLGNATTIAGTYEFSGIVAFAVALTFSGNGVSGTASIFRTATDGVNIRGVNGSTNAFALMSASGTIMLRNPQGTTGLTFATAVTFDSTIAATGAITATGGFLSGSDDALLRTVGTGSAAISGGTASNSGGNLVLYGATHATLANRWRLRHGATVDVEWDGSQVLFTPTVALTTLAGSGTRIVTATAAGVLGSATAGSFGLVGGSGVSGRVAYWSATDTITGSANLTFSGTALAVTGSLSVSTTLGVTGVTTATGGIVFNGGGSNLNHYEVGSYTATLTGCTTSPTVTVNFTRIGNMVFLSFASSLTATSNTSTCTITGAPSAIRPATAQALAGIYAITDGGGTIVNASATDFGEMGTGGTIVLYRASNANGFSAGTNKGMRNSQALGAGTFTCCYLLT